MIQRRQVKESDRGQRLDAFLDAQLTDLSKTAIRKIIDLGGVHVDNRRIRTCDRKVAAGQNIEVHLDGEPLTPYRISMDHVLYQDEYLIGLHKPAGVNTQPTPARYKGTLYEALQKWLGRSRQHGRKLEIGMAQRLDRDTSGVLVFSIHPRSHKGLTEQVRARTMVKRYLALVAGTPNPERGSYRSSLARSRRSGSMKSVASGGKEAMTHYRVRQSSREASLVEVELVTGRMHQIRAHFSEAGHPILGDSRYGGARSFGGLSFRRQCLHSWYLEMVHPVSGETLQLSSPIPADMHLDHFGFGAEIG
jgi:23S rRNA pseudouridine1911/1915/1917 synthase